jgi:hypothetical protein
MAAFLRALRDAAVAAPHNDDIENPTRLDGRAGTPVAIPPQPGCFTDDGHIAR